MKHAFKRLQELTPEQIEEVDRRLLAGEPPSVVAAWLQEDQLVFLDLKTASLKKNLERYRGTDLKDKVIDSLTTAAVGKSAVKLAGNINAMTEMELLVAVQKGRVEKLLVHEANLPPGIVLTAARDELRLLKEGLVELGKLQLETGVLQRAAKKVSGVTTDLMTGEVRRFEWTEEQEQLYKQIDGIPYTEVEHVVDA